jgi:ABC-type transporter Mla subunit MlaD
MERIMTTAINTSPATADQLGTLLAQIATLTKQADAIKDALKDAASNGGPTVFEGALFKATYVESNRSVVDWKAVAKDRGLDESYLAQFTSTTAVFSIKTTAR